MSDANPLLVIHDLHVERENREILRGVDLTVEAGTIHAVLGLNGSGKSTLAYALMGSAGYAPTHGSIALDGEEISQMTISERSQRGLTLAWQEPARFEGLTVKRYLDLGQRAPDPTRTQAALEAVALGPEYMDRFVDEGLSGGERKRIELASVYAMQPKLAILDEPDSGIDALSLGDIAALLERMVADGTTVLVISHRDEIVNIAHTASLICEGVVVLSGEPEIVCRRYAHCCGPCERREIVELEQEYERF